MAVGLMAAAPAEALFRYKRTLSPSARAWAAVRSNSKNAAKFLGRHKLATAGIALAALAIADQYYARHKRSALRTRQQVGAAQLQQALANSAAAVQKAEADFEAVLKAEKCLPASNGDKEVGMRALDVAVLDRYANVPGWDVSKPKVLAADATMRQAQAEYKKALSAAANSRVQDTVQSTYSTYAKRIASALKERAKAARARLAATRSL